MAGATLEITAENFQSPVIESDKVVLVDFWAEWCGPCKMLSPVIDELANDYASDQVEIGKVNVDDNQEIAKNYGIRSIPCLLFFKNGKVEKQIVGAIDKQEISTIIEDLK